MINKNLAIAQIAKKVRPVIRRLVNKGFDTQKDPYGNKWDETKTGQKFDKDNGLQQSITVNATTDSVTVKTSKFYTLYHQEGTTHLPSRKIVPTSIGNNTWDKPIKKVIDKEIAKVLANVKQSGKG